MVRPADSGGLDALLSSKAENKKKMAHAVNW